MAVGAVAPSNSGRPGIPDAVPKVQPGLGSAGLAITNPAKPSPTTTALQVSSSNEPRDGVAQNAGLVTTDVTLPTEHAHLLACFTALERTLPLLRARGLPPLYGLLVKSVEAATSRNFTPEVLAAVVGVWPEAYVLTVAQTSSLSTQRARLSATVGQKLDWHLALPASEASTFSSGGAPSAEQKAATTAGRIREFRQRLGAHSRTPSPLPMAVLPSVAPPEEKDRPLERLMSARGGSGGEKSGGAHGGGSGGAVTTSTSDTAAAPAATSSTPVAAVVPAGCEGLPAALVEKVLRRQAANQVRSEEAPVLHRTALMRRLPEMAAAMRSCMHEAGRRVMPQAELVKKLTVNGKWLASAAELCEQQRLLSEIVPQWCQVISVGDQPAVRLMDNAVRFPEILQAIREAAKQAAIECATRVPSA